MPDSFGNPSAEAYLRSKTGWYSGSKADRQPETNGYSQATTNSGSDGSAYRNPDTIA